MPEGYVKTITMQGFTLATITNAEKTKLECKNYVKYRSRALGQGVCLKGPMKCMSRTIIMQGFTLAAIL